MVFYAPIFTKLTNSEQHCVQIPCKNFMKSEKKSADSRDRN